jgi:DNA-binding transcriptional regulator YdaS (Cro superfamily)
MKNDVIQEAIDRAGGLKALASAIGVSPPSIIGWRHRGTIPAERVAAVAAASGMLAAVLRPDLAAAFAAVPAQPGIPEVQALLDAHRGEAA